VPKSSDSVQADILERIFLDGDQLTDEWARNAQLANAVVDTPCEGFCGLETSFADWHLGKNLFEKT
jgi:hypothetical protein